MTHLKYKFASLIFLFICMKSNAQTIKTYNFEAVKNLFAKEFAANGYDHDQLVMGRDVFNETDADVQYEIINNIVYSIRRYKEQTGIDLLISLDKNGKIITNNEELAKVIAAPSGKRDQYGKEKLELKVHPFIYAALQNLSSQKVFIKDN